MPPIDFQLCVKCEGAKVMTVKGKGCVLEPLVTPNAETYMNFVDSVKERAKYGNAEYVRLEQRLHGLTADELKRKMLCGTGLVTVKQRISSTLRETKTDMRRQLNVKIQVSCHTETLEVILNKQILHESGSSVSSTSATLTRSSVPSFKRELCFYCQSIKFKAVKHQAGRTASCLQ